jgi:hypothetical protein
MTSDAQLSAIRSRGLTRIYGSPERRAALRDCGGLRHSFLRLGLRLPLPLPAAAAPTARRCRSRGTRRYRQARPQGEGRPSMRRTQKLPRTLDGLVGRMERDSRPIGIRLVPCLGSAANCANRPYSFSSLSAEIRGQSPESTVGAPVGQQPPPVGCSRGPVQNHIPGSRTRMPWVHGKEGVVMKRRILALG